MSLGTGLVENWLGLSPLSRRLSELGLVSIFYQRTLLQIEAPKPYIIHFLFFSLYMTIGFPLIQLCGPLGGLTSQIFRCLLS